MQIVSFLISIISFYLSHLGLIPSLSPRKILYFVCESLFEFRWVISSPLGRIKIDCNCFGIYTCFCDDVFLPSDYYFGFFKYFSRLPPRSIMYRSPKFTILEIELDSEYDKRSWVERDITKKEWILYWTSQGLFFLVVLTTKYLILKSTQF